MAGGAAVPKLLTGCCCPKVLALFVRAGAAPPNMPPGAELGWPNIPLPWGGVFRTGLATFETTGENNVCAEFWFMKGFAVPCAAGGYANRLFGVPDDAGGYANRLEGAGAAEPKELAGPAAGKALEAPDSKALYRFSRGFEAADPESIPPVVGDGKALLLKKGLLAGDYERKGFLAGACGSSAGAGLGASPNRLPVLGLESAVGGANRLTGFGSLLKAVEVLDEKRLVEGALSLLGPASNLGFSSAGFASAGLKRDEPAPLGAASNKDFCVVPNKLLEEAVELKRLIGSDFLSSVFFGSENNDAGATDNLFSSGGNADAASLAIGFFSDSNPGIFTLISEGFGISFAGSPKRLVFGAASGAFEKNAFPTVSTGFASLKNDFVEIKAGALESMISAFFWASSGFILTFSGVKILSSI